MLEDQKELLCALNANHVKYLVIGGHAVGLYSEPRGTKDLDVWVESAKENSEAVYRALLDFGAPLAGVSPGDFNGHPEMIFQMGVPPARIDILQNIEGVTFSDAWERRNETYASPEIPAYFISREDLILNKLAVGRGQDLVDVEKIRDAAEDEDRSQPLPDLE